MIGASFELHQRELERENNDRHIRFYSDDDRDNYYRKSKNSDSYRREVRRNIKHQHINFF